MKTSKNRACSYCFFFSDFKIQTPHKHPFLGGKQFGLFNPNYIITNSKSVCNMDNPFKDHINLPNSHPSVLRSLLVVLSKKIGRRAT